MSSSSTYVPGTQLSQQEQDVLIADLQKKLQAVEAEKEKAVREKVKLKIEAEYVERLLARGIVATSTGGIAPAGPTGVTDETQSSEATSVLEEYPEIPLKWINAIIKGTLDPLNLLELIPGYHHKAITDGHYISSEKKVLEDFGPTPLKWNIAFGVFARIVYILHGAAHPRILHAMWGFQIEILQAATIYDWQSRVLRVALHHHRMAVAKGIVTETSWTIPEKTMHTWCNQC